MSSALKGSSEAIPPVVAVRPMLMLTGFLGAGKTTLLRAILDEMTRDSYLCDVILNDRENAEIDRETLIDHAESVASLTGSCVCCEGMDELYDTVMKVSNSSNQALIVELNGTADPLPLLEGFTLLESKFLLSPRWQVCVIDARSFGKRLRYSELEKLQLETASHYLLSHISELSEENEYALEQLVKSINPQASRTSAIGLAQSLKIAADRNTGHAVARLKTETSDGVWGGLSSSFVRSANQHDRHHFAHEFTGCNVIIPEPVSEAQMLHWLQELPETVIRAKALVTLKSEPETRYLYERVGMEISPRPLPVRSVSQAPCSAIFIGADLEPEGILQQMHFLLHPRCHFPNK
ncbi:MAG: GTP-binding protein [Rubritalea sp.]|uniref:CobW family GTP-binding protein n=1 Tax=Rubritalea sp. TaxID=2109375 RepID=UPI003241BA44